VTYCDNCGRELPAASDRFAFPSVPVPVSSANAGESATLCRTCANYVADHARTWFDPDTYREDATL
jgi:hypothetical protein